MIQNLKLSFKEHKPDGYTDICELGGLLHRPFWLPFLVSGSILDRK